MYGLAIGKRFTMVIACSLMLVILVSAAAFAYGAKVYVPKDNGSYGATTNNTVAVKACDKASDDRYVYTQFRTVTGNKNGIAKDTDGAGGLCGSVGRSGQGGIRSIRACEQIPAWYDNCSS